MPSTLPQRFFSVSQALYGTGILLMAVLILCCVVITKAQDPVTKTVKISVLNVACFDDKRQVYNPYNYAGWVVKIGDQSFTLDANGQTGGSLTLTKGTTYSLDVVTPDGEENLRKVNYNQVIYDSSDKVNGTFLDSKIDRDGNVRLHLYESWAGETPKERQLEVYVGGLGTTCGEETKKEEAKPEAKSVTVFVSSMQCKKESYLNYSIDIDGHVVKPEFQTSEFGSVRVPLTAGKHKISIAVPDYADAKIDWVIFDGATGVKDIGKKAYITGELEFMLEEDFWSATALYNSSIFLYTMQDCPPPYEPPTQRFGGAPQIKIARVIGKAFISDAGSEVEREPVQGSYIDGHLIRTQLGASVELVTSEKQLIILEGGTVVTFKVMKVEGIWKITPFIKASLGGLVYRNLRFNRRPDGPLWEVVTPTARVTNENTVYSVKYDETSRSTTVAVEQGEVTVTPTNTSLNPFTLADHQMVDIFADRVSSISPYSPVADPKGSLTKEGGGLFNRPLLLVGIGAAALVGLLVVGAGITFLYRRANRAPAQPAFQQSGIKVETTPANLAASQRLGSLASPAVPTNQWRCPNPNCGKLVPAGKKFCTACGGTQSGVRVGATPANVASPAVATSERRCPNPQCGKLVPAAKKFCTACGTPVI